MLTRMCAEERREEKTRRGGGEEGREGREGEGREGEGREGPGRGDMGEAGDSEGADAPMPSSSMRCGRRAMASGTERARGDGIGEREEEASELASEMTLVWGTHRSPPDAVTTLPQATAPPPPPPPPRTHRSVEKAPSSQPRTAPHRPARRFQPEFRSWTKRTAHPNEPNT